MDKWEIEKPKTAEDCSFCEDTTRIFVLSPKVFATMQLLCREIKMEWQILLCGIETRTGIYVDGYYIPKQEVTSASVTNNDEITAEFVAMHRVIGTCHSHGSMGVFFSSTDETCTNFSMLKHHIVTNNDGAFKAISRVELPCGMTKFVDAIVRTAVPDVKKKNVKGIENIVEKAYVTTYHAGGTFYGTQSVEWKRGNKRNHAFLYDQERGFSND
jgi:proteasome lid subunit RPN8/RPN11